MMCPSRRRTVRGQLRISGSHTGTGTGVDVGVDVGVSVGVVVGVAVAVGLAVGVGVSVSVGVAVAVAVGEAHGVAVATVPPGSVYSKSISGRAFVGDTTLLLAIWNILFMPALPCSTQP